MARVAARYSSIGDDHCPAFTAMEVDGGIGAIGAVIFTIAFIELAT